MSLVFKEIRRIDYDTGPGQFFGQHCKWSCLCCLRKFQSFLHSPFLYSYFESLYLLLLLFQYECHTLPSLVRHRHRRDWSESRLELALSPLRHRGVVYL